MFQQKNTDDFCREKFFEIENNIWNLINSHTSS